VGGKKVFSIGDGWDSWLGMAGWYGWIGWIAGLDRWLGLAGWHHWLGLAGWWVGNSRDYLASRGFPSNFI
jgi:hypothetical protein